MRELNNPIFLRSIFLSILFVFYYGLIAALSYCLILPHSALEIKCFIESYWMLLFSGFVAGFFIFIIASPRIELGLKYYWRNRDLKGIFLVCLYILNNLGLFIFPVILVKNGFGIIQQISPHFFLLGTILFVIISTFIRFRSLANPGC